MPQLARVLQEEDLRGGTHASRMDLTPYIGLLETVRSQDGLRDGCRERGTLRPARARLWKRRACSSIAHSSSVLYSCQSCCDRLAFSTRVYCLEHLGRIVYCYLCSWNSGSTNAIDASTPSHYSHVHHVLVARRLVGVLNPAPPGWPARAPLRAA